MGCGCMKKKAAQAQPLTAAKKEEIKQAATAAQASIRRNIIKNTAK